MSRGSWLRTIFTTRYEPDATAKFFLDRAQQRSTTCARVTVAVPTIEESRRFFGVNPAKRGVQPIYLQLENIGTTPLRLQLVRLSPDYFTPREASALMRFSILRQLSKWGLYAWFFFPLLWLLPGKLWTAWRANRRMDRYFQDQALHLRPIGPGESQEGFVFVPYDAGTKTVHVVLQEFRSHPRHAHHEQAHELPVNEVAAPAFDEVFDLPVPDTAVDHLHRDWSELDRAHPPTEYELWPLVEALRKLPATVTNRRGAGTGDPINLVIIGEYKTLLSAFVARWDETETISLASCWRTVKAFLLGVEYRYSPVSSLYLFGRSQDIALQRARESINERLHLRLWRSTLRYRGAPVWVGQVSRDIGVRFTTKTWNLTTHRIDPDVDESRDYVFEDLLHASRVESAGYLVGHGVVTRDNPRHNLTGDPYYTDGKLAVMLLSGERTAPRFVAWG